VNDDNAGIQHEHIPHENQGAAVTQGVEIEAPIIVENVENQ